MLLVVAAAACLVAALMGAASAAGERHAPERRAALADYHRCRDVVIRNTSGGIYTRTHGLFGKRASCRLARRLARRYLSNDGIRPPRILGFACEGGSDGVACRRGHQRVTWGYYFDRPAWGLTSVPRSRVSSDPSSWRLMPRGIGPLRLGMTATRARALVPELRVAHHRFCDTWSVPGLDGVNMSASHSRGGLSVASISNYAEDPQPGGHGTGGVELGESLRALKDRFGKRLRFVKRYGSLGKSFYRLYARPGGSKTAVEFTVDLASGTIEFQQAGFVGEFYYTDGVELCA
jgi:hypothetical protein